MHELLAVIVMMSLFAVLFGVCHDYEPDPIRLFPADYLLVQSRAMAKAESEEMESRVQPLPYLRFSDKGNVSKAMTLPIGRNNEDVIVELGPGKLVFR